MGQRACDARSCVGIQVPKTVSAAEKLEAEVKKKTENVNPYSPKTPGLHYGGVLCLVVGLDVKCVQYQTGAGVLAGKDTKCSAWDGGYLSINEASEEWGYLAMGHHGQTRIMREGGSAEYPPCKKYDKTEYEEKENLAGKMEKVSTAE